MVGKPEVIQLDEQSLGLIGNASEDNAEERDGNRAEAFSISRLEGRRWCLRRARPMEKEPYFVFVSPGGRMPLSVCKAEEQRIDSSWLQNRQLEYMLKVLVSVW